MTIKRILGRLELRLEEASSPRRVELAAHMFAQMIDAAFPGMPEDSVTMVVSNYAMGAAARARTAAGKTALQRVLAFMRNPERELARHPEREGILDAVVEFHREAAPKTDAIFSKGSRAKKPLAVLNNEFVAGLLELRSKSTHESATSRGSTVLYTPVLRVGRLEDDGPVRARVRIDGRFHDVRVREGATGEFFDAAKSGAEVAVHLDGAWFVTPTGETRIVPSRAEAVRIGDWSPTPSSDLLDEMRGASGLSELSSEEFLEVLERAQRGS